MKISIVIPVFNGGAFIEEAIQSVLDQQYPDKELIILDGGSTDGTVDIIKKYESHLSHWDSKPDGGQSNAINKGFELAKGDIINWLCCDDRLQPDALTIVADHFQNGDPGLKVVAGVAEIQNQINGKVSYWKPTKERLELMPCVNPFPQPSTFFRAEVIGENGQFVLPQLHYSMDFEMWNRIAAKFGKSAFHIIDDVLSTAIISEGNKTSVGGAAAIRELDWIYKKYSGDLIPVSTVYRLTRMNLDAYFLQNGISDPLRQGSGFKRFLWKLYSSILNRVFGANKVYSLSREWSYFYKQIPQ